MSDTWTLTLSSQQGSYTVLMRQYQGGWHGRANINNQNVAIYINPERNK